jgi:2-oxoisovalerate dehydrogenase E2 component (dihydrolipoyl transacylase)
MLTCGVMCVRMAAGSIGGTNATPLVNPPESAIVALGRVRVVPAFADDGSNRIVRRHVMNISWGADHRVVDGATIAQFSTCWKQLLEDPFKLLLHLR